MPGLNKIHLPLKTFQADSLLKRMKRWSSLTKFESSIKISQFVSIHSENKPCRLVHVYTFLTSLGKCYVQAIINLYFCNWTPSQGSWSKIRVTILNRFVSWFNLFNSQPSSSMTVNGIVVRLTLPPYYHITVQLILVAKLVVTNRNTPR